MSIAGAIAVSGMNVARLRLQVAAGNVANARSHGFSPRAVVQTDSGGGVSATVRTVNVNRAPSTLSLALTADTDGFAADPNFRLTNEMVRALLARYDLLANEKVYRADVRMSAALYGRFF